MPQVIDYRSLITSEHQGKPRFAAELATLLQPFVDISAVMLSMPGLYDVDRAQGVQLDAVGLWVGVGRTVAIALTGVYFSFDQTPGWDVGRWKGPHDDTTTGYRLDDGLYRTLIRARIAANGWDGTMAGAQTAYSYVFRDPNTRVFVQDNQDQSYSLNVAGRPLDVVSLALLTGGYLPIRSVTISLAGVNFTTVSGTALFGFDNSTSLVAGWDNGSWGVVPA